MKKALSFAILLVLSIYSSVNGQQNSEQVQPGIYGSGADTLQVPIHKKRHLVDLEIGGNSLLYSAGYTYSVNANWGIRVGFGYFDIPGIGDNDPEDESESYFRFLNIPVTVSYYKRRFELIAGFRIDKLDSQFTMFEIPDWEQWHFIPTAGAGYRYTGARFVFGAKISVSYIQYLYGISPVVPNLGVRFGYKF